MVSVYGPAREGMSCEHFGGYKTINQVSLPLLDKLTNIFIHFDDFATM